METQSQAPGGIPLCLDLDGTLIRSDLLIESALKLLREQPRTALAMPFWLLEGKSQLKQRVAACTDLRVDLLPYNQGVVKYAREANGSGRPVILATASDRKYAQQIAAHLGFFDEVHASDGTANLSAEAKARTLAHRYGEGGFDYVANARKDIPVWRRARRSVVVNPETGVLRRLQGLGVEHTVLEPRASLLGPLARALRPHQWLKNALVFLPLLTAHLYTDATAILACVAAFVAFSLAASAGYVVNDLLDLEADREHPRKRLRPFASGDLPLALGLALIPFLILGGLATAALLSLVFVAIVGVYLLVTMSYSLHLKKRTTVDVLLLAGLYTLRVIGGTAALGIPPSFWLLAFSMFLFLSLAFVKRFAELKLMEQSRRGTAAGRGYLVGDLELVRSFGISAGFGALMVLALYINSPEIRILYARPELIWLLCPVFLYWVIRVWTLAHRGLMHDDPMIFAVEDRLSQLSFLVAVIIVLFAA
jgi:4-hydroxybenzoate polyprenyltransferase/phosphoserine phosphatase